MLCLVILLSSAIFPSLGLEIVFEKCEQLVGFDLVESTLRVRKYNRTMPVLNGTIIMKADANDSFMVHTDLFHSRLGNQQFNHYPMKLPTSGMCEFIDHIHNNYPEVRELIINFPEKGACPITARDFHILNVAFPSRLVPPILPKGLWKMFSTVKEGNVDRSVFEVTVRAYSDNYF
uniref:MD-2-related lipid-recognition domain-containing protein n=1 Tax=Anopheles atroparvus TaxID=41427 RepID=A0AAG5DMA4_ANOAO